MSQNGRVRVELNIATGLMVLAILCISAMTCLGQGGLTSDYVKAVASMPSNSLLALITILSLTLTAYLIRLLFGKLLTALEANTQASSEMARKLAERPCIRNPKND